MRLRLTDSGTGATEARIPLDRRTLWVAAGGFVLALLGLSALAVAVLLAVWLKMPVLSGVAVVAAIALGFAAKVTWTTLVPPSAPSMRADGSSSLPDDIERALREVHASGLLSVRVRHFLHEYWKRRRAYMPRANRMEERYREPLYLLQIAFKEGYLTAPQLERLDQLLPGYEAFLAQFAAQPMPHIEAEAFRWACHDVYLYNALGRAHLLTQLNRTP